MSGKILNEEDFPVIPFLLRGEKRSVLKRYYEILRKGDDIADSIDLSKKEKYRAFKELLAECNNKSIKKIFKAFKADAYGLVKINNYDDLLRYCEYSAQPVADLLLDLFGEKNEKAYNSAYNLATALQLLNHCSDIYSDYKNLSRCYVPREWLETLGIENIRELFVKDKVHLLNLLIGKILDKVRYHLLEASGLPYYLSSTFLLTMAHSALYMAVKHYTSLKDSGEHLTRDFKGYRLAKRYKFKGILYGIYATFLKVRLSKNNIDSSYIFTSLKLSSSSFFYAMRLVNKHERNKIYCLYVLCHTLDDLVDDYFSSNEEKRQVLSNWQMRLEKVYKEQNYRTDNILINEIAQYLYNNDELKIYLDSLIKGLYSDIEDGKYVIKQESECLIYIERVATSPALAVASLLNIKDKDLITTIRKIAVILQQINILRDLYEDALNGRIYIPKERLVSYGVVDNDCKFLSMDKLRDIFTNKSFLLLYKDMLEDIYIKYYSCMDELNRSKAKNIYFIKLLSYMYEPYLLGMRRQDEILWEKLKVSYFSRLVLIIKVMLGTIFR